jgi:membrane protease YdiL (CAAX protease family)
MAKTGGSEPLESRRNCIGSLQKMILRLPIGHSRKAAEVARRVVVTGASGFVGSHLARGLSKGGHQVVGKLWIIFLITLVNGIAEELFFRGALFAAIGVRHPVLISTIIYTLATVAGGKPVLVFAAAVLGTVVALQRRAGGGVLAPILTHITWSLSMLFALPPIFAGAS